MAQCSVLGPRAVTRRTRRFANRERAASSCASTRVDSTRSAKPAQPFEISSATPFGATSDGVLESPREVVKGLGSAVERLGGEFDGPLIGLLLV